MVIHIFGASGSGTTTLGKYLSNKLDYFFIDVDDYYWLKTLIPFTEKRCDRELVSMIENDIFKYKNVVISGSLCGWGDELTKYFDLVIRLDTDTNLRISRLESRELNVFGDRILDGGDMYFNHKDFIDWAKRYDEGDLSMRSRMLHDDWSSKLKCNYICIDGGMELEDKFKIISKYL